MGLISRRLPRGRKLSELPSFQPRLLPFGESLVLVRSLTSVPDVRRHHHNLPSSAVQYVSVVIHRGDSMTSERANGCYAEKNQDYPDKGLRPPGGSNRKV